jgi:hypothetical protein
MRSRGCAADVSPESTPASRDHWRLILVIGAFDPAGVAAVARGRSGAIQICIGSGNPRGVGADLGETSALAIQTDKVSLFRHTTVRFRFGATSPEIWLQARGWILHAEFTTENGCHWQGTQSLTGNPSCGVSSQPVSWVPALVLSSQFESQD